LTIDNIRLQASVCASRQQMANVVDGFIGLVVIIARSRNYWNALLESQVPIRMTPST